MSSVKALESETKQPIKCGKRDGPEGRGVTLTNGGRDRDSQSDDWCSTKTSESFHESQDKLAKKVCEFKRFPFVDRDERCHRPPKIVRGGGTS
jgi:hypothetical protein